MAADLLTGLETRIRQLQGELEQTRAETQATLQHCAHTLEQTRIDSAKVMHALDCALQTVDALLAWMPEGLTLSPEVSGCKQRLNAAMDAMIGGIHR
jgi:hypothetical protein